MDMGFLAQTSKTPINTPKESKFFLTLLHFPCFFLIIQLLLVCFEVFIGASLVLGKNPCPLAVKL